MRLIIHKRLFLLSILGFFYQSVTSQVSIPGQSLERIEKSKDTTTLSMYTSIRPVKSETFQLIDPLFKISWNGTYPRGFNDGPVWKGKGLTLETHAGFTGSWGKLSYTFFPTVFFSQNGKYDLEPGATESENQYAYQFSNQIDWVQKYGSDAFLDFHLGQSEIKMDWGKIITSISTQNYSLGPSIYNPILLSRQGGGFPHMRIGLEPSNLKIAKKDIGKIEANFIVGLLSESDYFDEDTENNTRYFNGLMLGYSPSFLPEVTIGFNKVLYKQTQFFEPEDLVSTLFIVDDGVVDGDTLSPNDAFDQMASVFLEWNLKKSGFRVYAEFAKNDFTTSSDFRFFAVELEHARAYTIGFEKQIKTKKGKLINIVYEHTNLSRNLTYLWRASPTYYVHNINTQGYTHDGQIIGAGIGPGGNSDHFEITRVDDNWTIGILLQRIENNKDYFAVNIQQWPLHDVEYSGTLMFNRMLPKASLFFEGTLSHNYNRYYINRKDRANLFMSIGYRLKL